MAATPVRDSDLRGRWQPPPAGMTLPPRSAAAYLDGPYPPPPLLVALDVGICEQRNQQTSPPVTDKKKEKNKEKKKKRRARGEDTHRRHDRDDGRGWCWPSTPWRTRGGGRRGRRAAATGRGAGWRRGISRHPQGTSGAPRRRVAASSACRGGEGPPPRWWRTAPAVGTAAADAAARRPIRRPPRVVLCRSACNVSIGLMDGGAGRVR